MGWPGRDGLGDHRFLYLGIHHGFHVYLILSIQYELVGLQTFRLSISGIEGVEQGDGNPNRAQKQRRRLPIKTLRKL